MSANSTPDGPPIIAVLGPTASGKSELGIFLAQSFGGEIINCDSVQVYQDLWAASAKLRPEERGGVPHHLLDFVPPELPYTAADWARDALAKIDEIETRGRLAFLVGGSFFYLRALREPFFEAAPTDSRLRERLCELRARRGPEHLHRLLRRFDAESAARLHPRDWSRVQRALEVRLQTGRPVSAQRTHRPPPPPSAARLRLLALAPPRDELYRRIDARAETHFRSGLVEEVRDLLSRGVPPATSALGAHAYRRAVEYLRGERDLASAVEQSRLDVRHYAKRQMTWLRREPGVVWLEGSGDEAGVKADAAKHVAAWLESL